MTTHRYGLIWPSSLIILRSVAKDDGTTNGRLFERLIRSFLRTDELYCDRFRNVWLWNEYPGKERQA